MRRWLEREASSGQLDLIHNHGLWMMPNVYPGRICRQNAKCRLVISPRGTLSAWSLSLGRTRKRVFWSLLQRRVLQGAACFHATAESEYREIRAQGFRQPVCILPNGIDIPSSSAPPNGNRRQLLFLGRIHRTKGVDFLLRAWRAVEARFPEWDLHIAGADDGGFLDQMRALASELEVRRVTFLGPLYGKDKQRAFQSASLFVLPTHSENYGVTVAEALAAGTPAIVTVGAPWRGLATHHAGWWIEMGVDSLVACLEEALDTPPEQLQAKGAAGREWMARDFSWPRIAEHLSLTYRWLFDDGPPPSCVQLN
jgi:glycosyltransferase involved in cell wall biosynthesis